MNIVPKLTIFLCTFIGASTIVVAEPLLAVVPPFFLLGIRFTLAALLLGLLIPKKVFPISRESLNAGLLAGLGFGAGCAMLYLALPHVRAGKLTFLIALEVVLVPIICLAYYRQRISRNERLALLPAVVGLWLLTGGGEDSISWWEVIGLLSAVAYSIYTISLSHSPPTVSVFSRSFISFLLIGFCSLGISLVCESTAEVDWTTSTASVLVYLVVVGSVARFLLQAWAQKFLSASFAALTFSAEPVFAIMLSFALLDERFTLAQSLGAVLILTALVLSNFPSAKTHHP